MPKQELVLCLECDEIMNIKELELSRAWERLSPEDKFFTAPWLYCKGCNSLLGEEVWLLDDVKEALKEKAA